VQRRRHVAPRVRFGEDETEAGGSGAANDVDEEEGVRPRMHAGGWNARVSMIRATIPSSLAGAWPGRASPLGASWDGSGVNFAVFSEHAEAIDVCLFDPQGSHELRRVRLPEKTNQVFHGYLPGVGPGQLYGLRAQGEWAPDKGNRFNPAKLLVDPYARAIAGKVVHSAPLQGHDPNDAKRISRATIATRRRACRSRW